MSESAPRPPLERTAPYHFQTCYALRLIWRPRHESLTRTGPALISRSEVARRSGIPKSPFFRSSLAKTYHTMCDQRMTELGAAFFFASHKTSSIRPPHPTTPRLRPATLDEALALTTLTMAFSSKASLQSLLEVTGRLTIPLSKVFKMPTKGLIHFLLFSQALGASYDWLSPRSQWQKQHPPPSPGWHPHHEYGGHSKEWPVDHGTTSVSGSLMSASMPETTPIAATSSTPSGDTGPTAALDCGVVTGTTTSLPAATATVNKFLGIPFAQSPPERFGMPQRPGSCDVNATAWKPACIQQFVGSKVVQAFTELIFNNPAPEESEDCMYLNIYAPSSPPPADGRAVLFWIYGGALEFGNAGQQFYDGSWFAAYEDVIIVTTNYRTNVSDRFPTESGRPRDLPLTVCSLGIWVRYLTRTPLNAA